MKIKQKIKYLWWWLTDRGKYTYWAVIEDPKPWGDINPEVVTKHK